MVSAAVRAYGRQRRLQQRLAAGFRMLNNDIWDVIAEMFRGDMSTLCACALLSSAACRSMQRELFRTITMKGQDSSATYRLVQSLTARPSLASYIRRLEVGKVALKVLADFARPGPADVISRLACVQELRIERLRSEDEALFRNMSGCFPSLVVLELYVCRKLPLWCIPTIFPTLHALYMCHYTLPRDITDCHLDAGVLRLSLKTFSYTARREDTSLFVERCFSLKRVECLCVGPGLIPSLWTTFRNSGTRLRHLFLQCDSGNLEAQFSSCRSRSNTLLAGLQTLAVTLDLDRHDPNDSLRSFVTLVDSIPSASLVHFTLLLKRPYRHLIMRLNWAPLADAIQRLDYEVSPGARKVVRVAVLADMISGPYYMDIIVSIADEVVPLVQSATQCIRPHADMEVIGGTDVTFGAVSPVPHFALVL